MVVIDPLRDSQDSAHVLITALPITNRSLLPTCRPSHTHTHTLSLTYPHSLHYVRAFCLLVASLPPTSVLPSYSRPPDFPPALLCVYIPLPIAGGVVA